MMQGGGSNPRLAAPMAQGDGSGHGELWWLRPAATAMQGGGSGYGELRRLGPVVSCVCGK